jgi:hypothetical protein
MDLGSITGAPLGHLSLTVDIVFAGAFLVTGWLGARVAAGLHNSVLTMFYSIASAALVLLTATAAARAHGLVALIAPPPAGSQSMTATAAATAILAALHAACLALGLIALRASRALQTSKSANKSKN